METFKKGKKHIGKISLMIGNIMLIIVAVLFTLWYSNNFRTNQEKLILDNFCTTVDTMKQISARYLLRELESATNWASYIEQEHMTMDEAINYISLSSKEEDCEAHFVDMDTFEAWSTKSVNGKNYIGIYSEYLELDKPYKVEYVERIRKMFNGEKYVFGRYKLRESQNTVISVGHAVTLSLSDSSNKKYLLLRVVPVERMKELWLFPVNYSSAEIGLIALNGDYVIPSNSMRSANFFDFIQYYNYYDDYEATEKVLSQIRNTDKGLLELNDSKKQSCYWYYSKLDEFNGTYIVGYIPKSALAVTNENLSVVIVVAGLLLLMALIDGTYILNINHRLRVTADIANKASNAKTRFLSAMSHDIRTPLNAVLGMTKLAQSHMDDVNYVQECLRKISLSGNHLLTLINDILEISRVESGQISINPVPFDVYELVSELESITRSQAIGRGLEFNVEIKELPKPLLIGDKLRLTQVYLNLLNNAVKYTNTGGNIYLEFKEECLEDGNVLLIFKVEDNGIGMSQEFQKTMYDSFTRVVDSRIDKIQGTGLGLSIVKQMVQLMEGTIECISAEGEGTTFIVQIPLAVSSDTTVITQESREDSLDISEDLTGIHVLVAEDNELNWDIISDMLVDYGISCNRAENGKECVEILNEAPPNTYDLVFMDVQMPILNGRDATRKLRDSARADLREIPIIAMTADAFAEDVQMCLDAGMDAHVAKPIEMDKVLVTIRKLLARKKM